MMIQDTIRHSLAECNRELQTFLEDPRTVPTIEKITGILAEEGIGIFAVSTFNTDYVLVRKDRFAHALQVLEKAGYEIL